jgi:hypothetical protein
LETPSSYFLSKGLQQLSTVWVKSSLSETKM